MKEINAIISAYKSIDFSTTKAALATVVRVEGSSYRRTGARMLIMEDGNFSGGISGGCLEGDTLRRAQKAMFQNKPVVITYDTTQSDGHQIGVGLGCNGIIDVLISPIDPSDSLNPVRLLSTVTTTRQPVVLVTVTGPASVDELGKCFLYDGNSKFQDDFINQFESRLDEDVASVLHEQQSKTVVYESAGGELKLFIELILPAIQLVMFGGNYDVPALARIAKELGWIVTVVTNVTKVHNAVFDLAKLIDSRSDKNADIDNYTAVMLMSHDYKTDLNNLQKVLKTEASYIGLLGPRKRGEKIFDELAAIGFAIQEQDFDRIYAPAGLDIGAATPEEIALSVLAEIRAHFANREGRSLRLRQGTIYGN